MEAKLRKRGEPSLSSLILLTAENTDLQRASIEILLGGGGGWWEKDALDGQLSFEKRKGGKETGWSHVFIYPELRENLERRKKGQKEILNRRLKITEGT